MVKDAAGALAATDAVHLSGRLVDSSPKKPLSVDVQLQGDGTSGTLTIGGHKVQLIAFGGTTYLKAPAGFYVSEGANAAAAAKLENRWVKEPNSREFDTFTLSSLSKQLGQSPNAKINEKVATGTLNGQQVVIVSESAGSKLYVAATGKPFPLNAVNSAHSKDGSGALTFSDYGKHQTIKAPSGAIELTVGGSRLAKRVRTIIAA